METKIAIIVASRYVFWAAGMPEMLSRPGSALDDPTGGAYSTPQTL